MTEGEDVAESLETYAAKQAITEVLYRYCHAVDRIDADLASGIWHPDGVARYEDIFEGHWQWIHGIRVRAAQAG